MKDGHRQVASAPLPCHAGLASGLSARSVRYRTARRGDSPAERFVCERFVLLPVKFFARRDGFMWGRLAACGRVVLGPASGARLRARRSGPRQPGISRAVGLRLCCSAGQVANPMLHAFRMAGQPARIVGRTPRSARDAPVPPFARRIKRLPLAGSRPGGRLRTRASAPQVVPSGSGESMPRTVSPRIQRRHLKGLHPVAGKVCRAPSARLRLREAD